MPGGGGEGGEIDSSFIFCPSQVGIMDIFLFLFFILLYVFVVLQLLNPGLIHTRPALSNEPHSLFPFLSLFMHIDLILKI